MKKGDLFNSIGVFRESLGYDAHGNITSISRYGKISSSGYGAMDNLTLSYDGNRLTGVSDAAADYDVAGSFEYKRANGSQYMYDSNGSLLADKSRGITYVAYDVNNNPQQIYIDNAGDTKYVYDASGRKLRVIHLTAVPNIMRKFGRKPADLTPSQILYADTTDYLLGGSLTLRNGRLDKLQFEEGYCQAEQYAYDANRDKITFYYYDRDHLGNVRQVTTATGTNKGTVVQRMDYYPFGAQLCGGTYDSNFQSHKYNGKELDRMHGLNTYDYGARQYNPILGRWDRMDPLCEKYYNVSPYAYCGNNPVRYIDPDGKKIVMSQKNSQEFNYQYNNAITYLKEHGCSSLISYLEEIPIEITIEEIGSNEQNYTVIDLGVNKIGWNAKQGMLTDLGYKLSPAIRLFHEFAHQEHKLRNPKKFLEDTVPNDSFYQSEDDESIIKNEETYAARNCGEIPQDAISRGSHGGINFETTSSTSRDIINSNEDIRLWQYTWGEIETY